MALFFSDSLDLGYIGLDNNSIPKKFLIHLDASKPCLIKVNMGKEFL